MKTFIKSIIILTLLMATAQLAMADVVVNGVQHWVHARLENMATGLVIADDTEGSELGEFVEDASVSMLFDAAASQNSMVTAEGDELRLSGSFSAALDREEIGEWVRAEVASTMSLVFVPVVDSVLSVTFHAEGNNFGTPSVLVRDIANFETLAQYGETGEFVASVHLDAGGQYLIQLYCNIGLQGNGLPEPLLCTSVADITVLPTVVAVESMTLAAVKRLFE